MSDEIMSVENPDWLKIWATVHADVPVLDLSHSGLAIETSFPMHIGKNYAFLIKSQGSHVILEGEVVRCTLKEIAEQTDGGSSPVYHSGVALKIERDPVETRLLEMMRETLRGEKRLAGRRVRTGGAMRVAIGRPFVGDILRLTLNDVTVQGPEILDLDDEWVLLLQTGHEALHLPSRVVHASHKDGAASFIMRFEFLNPSGEAITFLKHAIGNKTSS